MKIPLTQIAPRPVDRPDAVRAYAAMLREGKKAPAIWIIKQRNRHHRYRIFDGAHRFRAAKRAGQKTIEARILTERTRVASLF